MDTMTWDEFKAEIDRQLEELGFDGDVPIWYIDISFPYMDIEICRPEVCVDEVNGLFV